MQLKPYVIQAHSNTAFAEITVDNFRGRQWVLHAAADVCQYGHRVSASP